MRRKTNTSSKDFFDDDLGNNFGIVMPILTECDTDEDFADGIDRVGNVLPILPLRNMVLFPSIAMPVLIGRSKSMRLVNDAIKKKKLIGVVCQKEMNTEDPRMEDLHSVGVIAEVVRVLEMPDGSTTVILQGKKRFELIELLESDPYLRGKIRLLEDEIPQKSDREFEALISTIKDLTVKMLSATVAELPRELLLSIKNNKNVLYLINFSCGNIPISSVEKQELLLLDNLRERAFRLLFILNREYQLVELKNAIQLKTHEDINQQQKEYFLQQQIKTIQEELGGNINDSEIKELKAKVAKKKWPESVAATFDKELRKLERLHPQSPDFSMQTHYVQTIVSLPWNEYSKDNFNLAHAQRVLNKGHYGLEKVKERIIEHLAVLKLKGGDMKSPILCLYGPPGVGKTSLGKSVAEALNRKYARISLGGLHDEAEIRGHRRTYIGALCGRIIQNIMKVGTSNPVFILDEIDKVTNDFKGDPASALLEVLDPEQNSAFHDNYLDIDYDLSRVLFISTANNLNTISQPLLDRMELIEVSGYIMEEKVQIASRHLIPKQMEAHGLPKGAVKIRKKTLEDMIVLYTRESGVRELDKKIARLMRKLARKLASDEPIPADITPEHLHEYLGTIEYTRETYQGNEYAGVVIGLAWTAVGGEILFVESSLSKGKGSKLALTGNLGDVMKESAMLALEYIHSHAGFFGIAEEMFENWNVHIHVPEGAIPKDGPSAGITMVTSLVSSFTQRKVKENIAMTGEITLRGKVLPVGGIKEKILAAKRAGIKELILCKVNQKDIDEINADYLKGLTFHYVTDIMEVIDKALLEEKVSKPLF
jgi:ATP-dependent Lon protease